MIVKAVDIDLEGVLTRRSGLRPGEEQTIGRYCCRASLSCQSNSALLLLVLKPYLYVCSMTIELKMQTIGSKVSMSQLQTQHAAADTTIIPSNWNDYKRAVVANI